MTRAAPEPMPALPEDVGALQALLRAAWTERDSVAAERDALAEQNDRKRCVGALGAGRHSSSSSSGGYCGGALPAALSSFG